jgi:hypothetical protein
MGFVWSKACARYRAFASDGTANGGAGRCGFLDAKQRKPGHAKATWPRWAAMPCWRVGGAHRWLRRTVPGGEDGGYHADSTGHETPGVPDTPIIRSAEHAVGAPLRLPTLGTGPHLRLHQHASRLCARAFRTYALRARCGGARGQRDGLGPWNPGKARAAAARCPKQARLLALPRRRPCRARSCVVLRLRRKG